MILMKLTISLSSLKVGLVIILPIMLYQAAIRFTRLFVIEIVKIKFSVLHIFLLFSSLHEK